MDHCPWVEKYRPTNFEDIVLDKKNKKILLNIIKKNYFTNLLFYCPTVTGKTTTIINLINLYRKTYNLNRKGYMIHLNASDDRGIDIIRNQISQFVNTKTLFGDGMKFVILDEVDYMTKNAQHALKYLIQQYSNNVRFCLICNYISRIDTALQNEFVRLRFCQLPKENIYTFLNMIQEKENLNISKPTLVTIQNMFKSDIRSMVNFLQSNHSDYVKLVKKNLITNKFWETLIVKIKKDSIDKNILYIDSKCELFNIEIKNFIMKFVYYLLSNKKELLDHKYINHFKFIIHNSNVNDDYFINYSLKILSDVLSVL
jgi:replication factor C subunit 3/5